MAHKRRLLAVLAGTCAAASLLLGAGTASADTAAPPAPAAPPATATDPAVIAQQVATQNKTLLPFLQARGGKVTADKRFVVMPDKTQVSLVPMSLADCPSGWVCLYQDLNYAGRMLKWSDPGTAVDLTAAGFNDQMSSWSNKGPYDARWFYNAGYLGTTRCLQPYTNNSYVGDGDSNKASSFRIYTDARAC